MADLEQLSKDWNYPGLPCYVTALQQWFYFEQEIAHKAAVEPVLGAKQRLYMGVLVYGRYVERFIQLCIPSLLAEGNVPALDDPLIVIHTDEASVLQVVEAVEKKLTSLARVEVHIVPQELLDMVPENEANKYWLLGAAHNLHMKQAMYRCRSYHMLMPDHVYARGYFENLVRLWRSGAQAIVQANLSAQMEAVAPVLERCGGSLEAADMTGLALANLHPQVWPFVMNGRSTLPGRPYLVLIGEQEVQIISPHMSIVFLSWDLLKRAPLRLFNTIDGELPWFIPEDVTPVVPGPEDGMVYMEVSDAQKEPCPNESCSIEEFCATFWVITYCVRRQERFMGLTTRLPLSSNFKLEAIPFRPREMERIARYVREEISDTYQSVYDHLPERMRVDPIEWVAAEEVKKGRSSDARLPY